MISSPPGTHITGLAIANTNIKNITPLVKNSEDFQPTIQLSIYELDSLGILNLSIIGLRILDIIEKCEKYIRQNNNPNFCIKNIAFDDNQTYKLLQKGQTIGCFQLGSVEIRKILRDIKPDRFADISALLAMYRPGPLDAGIVAEYIARKHGQTKYQLPFPELEPYLNETYGIILYQEQLMYIANIIGGFNMTEADKFRRAMGRKKSELIAEFKPQFLANAGQKGFAKKETELLFKECVHYAEYGFTKAHAVAYGMLSYQTAYLKAHHPTEYMAAILDITRMLTPELERELHRMDISVNGYACALLRDYTSTDTCIKIILQGNAIIVDYEL